MSTQCVDLVSSVNDHESFADEKNEKGVSDNCLKRISSKLLFLPYV